MIKVNNYFRYSWVLESSPSVIIEISNRFVDHCMRNLVNDIVLLILRKVLRHSPSRMSLSFALRKSHKIVGWCSGLSQSSEHCAAPPTKNNMRGYRIWWISYETVRVGGGSHSRLSARKTPEMSRSRWADNPRYVFIFQLQIGTKISISKNVPKNYHFFQEKKSHF